MKIKEIEDKLQASGSPYIQGDMPSNIDSAEFDGLKDAPKPSDTPHAYGWYCLMSSFDANVRSTWGAPVKSTT